MKVLWVALGLLCAVPARSDSVAPAIKPLTVSTTAFDSVNTLSAMLSANGGDSRYVRRVALAVHTYSTLHQVDPVLVVGVIGVENHELVPGARNRSGATGIMQVMPHWLKDIHECGRRLATIETNVCLGTKILALNLATPHGQRSVPQALARYNGCRRGRRCRGYVRAVIQRASKAKRAVSPPTIAYHD